jgi:hypothetical protein
VKLEDDRMDDPWWDYEPSNDEIEDQVDAMIEGEMFLDWLCNVSIVDDKEYKSEWLWKPISTPDMFRSAALGTMSKEQIQAVFWELRDRFKQHYLSEIKDKATKRAIRRAEDDQSEAKIQQYKDLKWL